MTFGLGAGAARRISEDLAADPPRRERRLLREYHEQIVESPSAPPARVAESRRALDRLAAPPPAQHEEAPDVEGEQPGDQLARATGAERRAYKPGTRQAAVAKRETAPADPSWWMRPDADWQAEQQRMRDNPRAMKVPGENRILGMEGV